MLEKLTETVTWTNVCKTRGLEQLQLKSQGPVIRYGINTRTTKVFITLMLNSDFAVEEIMLAGEFF